MSVPLLPVLREDSPLRVPRPMLAVLAGAVAVLALAAPVSAVAQQAYPGSPYGDNSSLYANPYAQPAPPQNGYAPQQYAQPQNGQP